MDTLPTYRGMLTIVKEDKTLCARNRSMPTLSKKGPNILIPSPDRGSDEAFQCSCVPHTLYRISFFQRGANWESMPKGSRICR